MLMAAALIHHDDKGAKEAVLVAKHGCGFTLFPSNATQPDGKRYGYSVADSAWRNGQGDVARDFLNSMNKANISTGFYYSLGGSTYAGWEQWSAEQLIEVEKQQLTELWSTYGNLDHGGHSEVRVE